MPLFYYFSRCLVACGLSRAHNLYLVACGQEQTEAGAALEDEEEMHGVALRVG